MLAPLLLAAMVCPVPDEPVVAEIEGARIRPGALEVGAAVITTCDGLPDPHPTAIAAFGDKLAVGFRDAGVQVWDGRGFTPLFEGTIRALAADGDTLWVGTATQGLWRLTPGKREQIEQSLAEVREALLSLSFGSVAITVHEDRVVQIETTSKKRLKTA